MRRRLFGLACLCVLGLVAFLGSSAPSASAQACPNEALREQNGATFLPDCRAYEQVSPTDKNGNNIGLIEEEGASQPFKQSGPILSTTSGGTVIYTSHGGFTEPESTNPNNTYVASRGADWLTHSVVPPIWDGSPVFSVQQTQGFTPDFSTQLVNTQAALTPGATAGGNSIYIRHPIGSSSSASYELVAATAPSPPSFGATANLMNGYSADGVNWIFGSSGLLESTPPPVFSSNNVYEYANGELKLVGVLPGGTVSSGGSKTAGPGPSAFARRAVSDDGRQVYWQPASGSGSDHLYLYREGNSTLVSERESDHSAQDASLWFATPDGRYAAITSDGQLTGDASPAGSDLYRYDSETKALVDLTPTGGSAEVEGVLGISDDGSYVYFEATGEELAPGAIPGQHNIYVWHDGEIRLIATSESGFSEPLTGSEGLRLTRVSPSGDYLGFGIGGELTGPHPQPDPGAEEVYLYNYASDTLACSSCLPGEAEASGDARFERPKEGDTTQLGQYQHGLGRNLLDGGRLYFETPDALVAGDSNGRRDVYEYADGNLHLISTGKGSKPSFLGDASASGNDVFILTESRLVGQDKDNLYDLYDARVDGGISAQSPISESGGCEGETCQGSPAPAPSSSAAASVGFVGKGNVPSLRNCSKLGREAKKLSGRAKRLRKHAKAATRNGKNQLAKKRNKKATRLAKHARHKSKSAKKCRKANRRASK